VYLCFLKFGQQHALHVIHTQVGSLHIHTHAHTHIHTNVPAIHRANAPLNLPAVHALPAAYEYTPTQHSHPASKQRPHQLHLQIPRNPYGPASLSVRIQIQRSLRGLLRRGLQRAPRNVDVLQLRSTRFQRVLLGGKPPRVQSALESGAPRPAMVCVCMSYVLYLCIVRA
jgi:hypothetical protein